MSGHFLINNNVCVCKTFSPHRLGFELIDKVAEQVEMSLEMAVLVLHLSIVFDSVMKS